MFLTVRENLARSYKFENCSSSWDFTLLLHGKHQILHGMHQVLHGKHQVLHGKHTYTKYRYVFSVIHTSSFTWRTHLFISTSRKTWRTHLFRIISWKTWTTTVLSQIFHRKHEYSSFSKHDFIFWKKLAKSFVSRSCTQTCFWVSFCSLFLIVISTR